MHKYIVDKAMPSWSPYNHIEGRGGIDNQVPELYFFGLVQLSKSGLQDDVSFYFHLLPIESNQRTFEWF